MSSLAADPIDQIMEIMEVSFDPVHGEAWNRKQVSDALLYSNCHYILVDKNGRKDPIESQAAGFVLSRQASDEEELLLIAVHPHYRRRGIASRLIGEFVAEARLRRVKQVFLEMREGNPAQFLYLEHGFTQIGRRSNYYRRDSGNNIDAITYRRAL